MPQRLLDEPEIVGESKEADCHWSWQYAGGRPHRAATVILAMGSGRRGKIVCSGAGSTVLSSFPVELVYVESQRDVGDSGRMAIGLPRVNQPVTHLMVQLYLPKKGGYRKGVLGGFEWSFEGPLRRVEKFTHLSSAPMPPRVQLRPEAQAKQLQKQFDRRVEAAAVAAGVTPIRVNLPIRGEIFRFEKILVMEGDDLYIKFQYSNWEED